MTAVTHVEWLPHCSVEWPQVFQSPLGFQTRGNREIAAKRGLTTREPTDLLTPKFRRSADTPTVWAARTYTEGLSAGILRSGSQDADTLVSCTNKTRPKLQSANVESFWFKCECFYLSKYCPCCFMLDNRTCLHTQVRSCQHPSQRTSSSSCVLKTIRCFSFLTCQSCSHIIKRCLEFKVISFPVPSRARYI